MKTWLAIIFAITAVIFGSLLKAGPLTWDDDTNIFNNPYFLSGDWSIFWREPYFGLYVPVSSSFWELLYSIGRGSAVTFRIFNLILHIANTVLIYMILRGLAKRWSLPAVAVLFGTAIFAMHPLQVHAVAWISGGRELLAAFFALAATLVYFREDRRHSNYAGATALFLMATLCKPTAAMLPLVLIGLEFIINGRPTKSAAWRLALWTFFAGAVALLANFYRDGYEGPDLTLAQRATVVLDAYSFYLQKFVAPFALNANYARTPAAALADGPAAMIMAVTVIFGFVVLSWRRDRRYSLIFLWFLALLPVSGLYPFAHQEISTVSDHYNYLPMALLATLAAFMFSRIDWNAAAWRVVLGVLIGGFALLSWTRARAWDSDEAFFTDMSRQSPDSYSTALGMSIVMCEDVKNYEEGVKWTEIALKARPLDIVALSNQAYCFLHARNYFRVIELEYYLGQLNIDELEKNHPTAYSSLLSSIGSAYIEQQEYEDGFQFLCEALRVKPSEPSHAANLEIAKDLLKGKGIEPTCEQVQADEEASPTDPVQEIWPQFEQGPDGGPADSEED